MATSHFEHPCAAPVTLMLPDLDCNGQGYWQHDWIETRLDCRAIDLCNASTPDRNSWVMRLDHALRGLDAPVILVGHGVGALTIAAWAGLMSSEIEKAVAGALLIGPSDPVGADADPRLKGFAPVPSAIFSFPALVVASDDDHSVSVDRAFSMARQWGAGFARFGECGHFSPRDGLGWWPEGEELLDRFIELVEPGRDHRIRDFDDFAPRFARPGPPPPVPLFRP